MMNPRWQRTVELLESALAMSPDQRLVWLDMQCGADAELYREVVSLLNAAEAERNAPVVTKATTSTALRFGVWETVRELGAGGMGTVFLVKRADGEFDQLAALKLVAPHLAGDYFLERFRNERQILAQFNHPNITKLLDGGVSANGVPFLVMEYVDGLPIDDHCDGLRLGIRARLELFLKICDAVEFAHRRDVVHRDLKPSNILVETATGEPKLLDFGTARVAGPTDQAANTTSAVHRMVTPRYASPEALGHMPITPQSDVFSLGVLLYEQLTGTSPFGETVSPVEAVRRIVTGDLDDPESRITQATAALRSMDSVALKKTARGDLAAIIAKATRPKLEDRYPSVSALAADLRAYLAGKPVSASRAHQRRQWQRIGIAAALLVSALGAFAYYRTNVAPRDDGPVRTIDLGNASNIRNATISADGNWIAFEQGTPRPFVWIARAPKGGGRIGPAARLTKGDAMERQPALASDGSFVVYRSYSKQSPGLYRVELRNGASASEPQLVAAGGYRPRISPDNRKLVYFMSDISGADMLSTVTIPWTLKFGDKQGQPSSRLSGSNIALWAADNKRLITSHAAHGALIATRIADPQDDVPHSPMMSGPKPGAFWPCAATGSGFWSRSDQSGQARLWEQGVGQNLRPLRDVVLHNPVVVSCSGLASGEVAFTTEDHGSTIFELRGDTASGSFSTGIDSALESRTALAPYVDWQGASMAWAENSRSGLRYWVRDPQGKVAIPGTQARSISIFPDGSGYWKLEEDKTWTARNWRNEATHSLNVRATVLCWDASIDRRWLLVTSNETLPRPIVATDTANGSAAEVLYHPNASLFLARFSPDGRWVLFTAEGPGFPARMYIAPFRGNQPVPQQEWIDVGSGDYPAWDPTGSRIYFTGNYEQEIQSIALDPATKRPVGGKKTIFAADAEWTIRALPPGTFRLAVARKKLVFALGRRHGTIEIVR